MKQLNNKTHFSESAQVLPVLFGFLIFFPRVFVCFSSPSTPLLLRCNRTVEPDNGEECGGITLRFNEVAQTSAPATCYGHPRTSVIASRSCVTWPQPWPQSETEEGIWSWLEKASAINQWGVVFAAKQTTGKLDGLTDYLSCFSIFFVQVWNFSVLVMANKHEPGTNKNFPSNDLPVRWILS